MKWSFWQQLLVTSGVILFVQFLLWVIAVAFESEIALTLLVMPGLYLADALLTTGLDGLVLFLIAIVASNLFVSFVFLGATRLVRGR